MSQTQSPCITTSMVLSTAFDLGQSQTALPATENTKENPLNVTTRIVFRMDQSLDTTLNTSMYWPASSYNFPSTSYAGAGFAPMPLYGAGTLPTTTDTLPQSQQLPLNLPSLGVQQSLFTQPLGQTMPSILGAVAS